MRARLGRTGERLLVLIVSVGLLTMAGCDPTLKATVESGVITASQSLFGAFIQAVIQVAQETETGSSGPSGASGL
jgi:hypothetical protein